MAAFQGTLSIFELSLTRRQQHTPRDVRCLGGGGRTPKPAQIVDSKQRSWAERILKLTKMRQLDSVFEVLEEVTNDNVKPGRAVMNRALAACVHCGDIGKAYDVYRSMLQPGYCGVDDITYNLLLKGLSQKKMFDEAFELIESLENGTAPGGTVLTDVHVWTLLNGFAEAGQMMRAYGLLMRYHILLNTKGPSIFTYNILIKGFSRSDTPLEALKLKEELVKYGLQPQQVTYNSLIHACVQGRNLDRALQLFREMKEMAQCFPSLDLCPNIVTYTTLIKGFGQQHRFHEVASLVGEIKEFKRFALDRVAYGVIIDSYIAVDSASSLFHALSTLEEMIELSRQDRFLRPKPHTFLSLMRAFAPKGNFDVVLELHQRMIPVASGPVSPQNRVEADELLVEAAVNARQFAFAKNVLRHMKAFKLGLPISARAYLALIKLEFLSNMDAQLFKPYLISEGVCLNEPVKNWMDTVIDARPLLSTDQLSKVVMRFFYESIVPVVNKQGACIGVVHREDCYELNARLGDIMRASPLSISSIAPLRNAVNLLLESKAKIVVVFEVEKKELVGFFMLEKLLKTNSEVSV